LLYQLCNLTLFINGLTYLFGSVFSCQWNRQWSVTQLKARVCIASMIGVGCQCDCLSISLSVSLCLSLCVCLRACKDALWCSMLLVERLMLSVWLSVHQSVCLSVSVSLSVCVRVKMRCDVVCCCWSAWCYLATHSRWTSVTRVDSLHTLAGRFSLLRWHLVCMYVCMWIYIAQPLQPKQSRGASIG